jgi:hypothetical protein
MEIQCLRLFPGNYALALLGFGFEKQGLLLRLCVWFFFGFCSLFDVFFGFAAKR